MAISPSLTDMTSLRARPRRSLPRGPHQLTVDQVLGNQRDRLVDALLELVGLQGYAATSVADVLERAGVSRRSVYVLFPNRAELLKTSFELSAASMIEQVESSRRRSGHGALAQLEALMRPLCRSAHEQPGRIALWSVEIAADPQGAGLRGALMDRYAELIQDCTSAKGKPVIPHSLASTLAGALHREIDSVARDTPAKLSLDLPARLAQWASSYRPPPAGLELSPTRLECARRPDGLLGGRAPGTLAPASEGYLPRIGSASAGFRAHANRERVLDAVAQISAESGSAALGAQAILERAEVPENVFRSEFKNAKDAFIAVVELGHMKCQGVIERVQTEASSWRYGVRTAVQALLEFFASEPCFARLAFVDAPFAWPASARRTHEHVLTYARLMFGGAPRRPQPVPLAPVLTMYGLIELVFCAAVEDRLEQLPYAAREATYLALAPFVGAADAAAAASALR